MTSDGIVDEILSTFGRCGHLDYGEHISMQEHMLQSAFIAQSHGEPEPVIVATLLHDYGHLICNLPNQVFAQGRDNYHENVGADVLAPWFGPEIVAPIQLHVEAKRYLCATDPAYESDLSAASKTTLIIQGGRMNYEERQAFLKRRGSAMALKVRQYDDLGKQPTMERPELDYYVPIIRRCLMT
ncbi:MAG: HD domain-containing protein [Gammaproteobacteria bacterium]|nr:HD domain-containing protein [Gammaproteobacteria bacterium]